MSARSLKIAVDVPGWSSMEPSFLVKEIMGKVLTRLQEENYSVSESVVRNTCKNAISRVKHRGQNKSNVFIAYIPISVIDSSPSPVSSPGGSTNEDELDSHEDDSPPIASVVTEPATLALGYDSDRGLVIRANFIYLKRIFAESLSRSSRCTALADLIDDLFSYCCYSPVKLYVNTAVLRRQLSKQISCTVRKAKRAAATKHTSVHAVLIERNSFVFHSDIAELGQQDHRFSCLEFDSYSASTYLDLVLLVRNQDILAIERKNDRLFLTLSRSFVQKGLETFDLIGVCDVLDITAIVDLYCQQRKFISNTRDNEEALKVAMLETRARPSQAKFFTCTIGLDEKEQQTRDEAIVDLDTLLGPTYVTRGNKRKSQQVPLDGDSTDLETDLDHQDDLWRANQTSSRKRIQGKSPCLVDRDELRRKFLHIKDEHHITDSAIAALHKFFKERKQAFYSLAEIERVRSQANRKIPLTFTKDAAYVPFEFALRTAVFVAMKYRTDLLQLNRLTFRLSMDGTLMGNKHVVAISVNCVDGGSPCQTARKLVPVGIFEIQKESTELLRKTLPKDFLDSIRSIKQLRVSEKKCVDVKIRLGGDFQNSVYVFGLAGVHSNYPCVFCTQHKTYLHVTERNTQCEEEVWIGAGKNKRKEKRKIIVNPTSSYDQTLGARSLEEKTLCLARKAKAGSNNELGYQSEPLFGDLFEFSDYVIDSLHMRLRIFDILLKDILAEASRTGEYEPAHSRKLEEKIDVLNQHASSTIGKRFFFKAETENNIKTIVSCGRFSGHLQESFFIDSFPYEKLIQNHVTCKNAKDLVEKFKLILELIKTEKSKRTSVLADVAKSFVKEFRVSGLRTVCTPYMHLIGTHLAEQDEKEHLPAYDMQGVEKSNDLLSRLYFSSSNRARNPLKTMVQNLYRRLEMNFVEPNERLAMGQYARNGTLSEVDIDEDEHDQTSVTPSSDRQMSDTCPCDKSDGESDFFDDEGERDEEDDDAQASSFWTQHRFQVKRGENRWRSFKTK